MKKKKNNKNINKTVWTIMQACKWAKMQKKKKQQQQQLQKKKRAKQKCITVPGKVIMMCLL